MFTNQIVQTLTAVNWPVVYGSYAIALFIGVSCVVSIIAATKRA